MSDWPARRELCAIPGAYGTSDSKLMYDVRMLRVQVVHKVSADSEALVKRKSRLELR